MIQTPFCRACIALQHILESSFSVEPFWCYTKSQSGMKTMKHVVYSIEDLSTFCLQQKEECSLCQKKVLERKHHRPESWSSAMVSLFEQEEQELGLSVSQWGVCVCAACNVSLRRAMKARDRGEPHQLRIKKFVVCHSILQISKLKNITSRGMLYAALLSISSPVDASLCSAHYIQVYRTQHVV